MCVHAVLISSSLTWDVFAFAAEKGGGGGGCGSDGISMLDINSEDI